MGSATLFTSVPADEAAEDDVFCAVAANVVSVDGAEASEPLGVEDRAGAEMYPNDPSGTEPVHRPGRSGSGEEPGPIGRCIGTADLRLLGSQTISVMVLRPRGPLKCRTRGSMQLGGTPESDSKVRILVESQYISLSVKCWCVDCYRTFSVMPYSLLVFSRRNVEHHVHMTSASVAGIQTLVKDAW